MAYRDERETRRAEVRALESELASLREEVTQLRASPADRGLPSLLLGGPAAHRVVRSITTGAEPSATSIACALAGAYDVSAPASVSPDGAIVWEADVEPRGRSVAARIERAAPDALRLTIVDRRSAVQPALALIAAAMVLVMAKGTAGWVGIALATVVLLALLWARSRDGLAIARRRERQARDAIAAVTASLSAGPRIRVEEPDGDARAERAAAERTR